MESTGNGRMVIPCDHAERGIPCVTGTGVFQVAVIAGHQQHDIVVELLEHTSKETIHDL